MSKKITFTADNPNLPVVPSIKIDSCKDAAIILTRGHEVLELGYICSDYGVLELYRVSPEKAARFGVVLGSGNRIKVAD